MAATGSTPRTLPRGQLGLFGVIMPGLAQVAPAFNLFFTTGYLRDYHYQKQKANAFYHIQAINLPFQNVEFHYLPET